MNPMREIKIEKITINIGTGEAGEKLERAKKLLEKLKIEFCKVRSALLFTFLTDHKKINKLMWSMKEYI